MSRHRPVLPGRSLGTRPPHHEGAGDLGFTATLDAGRLDRGRLVIRGH